MFLIALLVLHGLAGTNAFRARANINLVEFASDENAGRNHEANAEGGKEGKELGSNMADKLTPPDPAKLVRFARAAGRIPARIRPAPGGRPLRGQGIGPRIGRQFATGARGLSDAARTAPTQPLRNALQQALDLDNKAKAVLDEQGPHGMTMDQLKLFCERFKTSPAGFKDADHLSYKHPDPKAKTAVYLHTTPDGDFNNVFNTDVMGRRNEGRSMAGRLLQMTRFYNVEFKLVDSVNAATQFLETKSKQLDGQVKHLVIAGHGNPTGVLWGPNVGPNHWVEGNDNKYSESDFLDTVRPMLMTEGEVRSTVVLNSCAGGACIGDGRFNVAQRLAMQLPGARVRAWKNTVWDLTFNNKEFGETNGNTWNETSGKGHNSGHQESAELFQYLDKSPGQWLSGAPEQSGGFTARNVRSDPQQDGRTPGHLPSLLELSKVPGTPNLFFGLTNDECWDKCMTVTPDMLWGGFVCRGISFSVEVEEKDDGEEDDSQEDGEEYVAIVGDDAGDDAVDDAILARSEGTCEMFPLQRGPIGEEEDAVRLL